MDVIGQSGTGLIGCHGHDRVTETEIHNERLEGPFVHGKCSLPFITFTNSHIVVSPSKIHLREEFTTF